MSYNTVSSVRHHDGVTASGVLSLGEVVSGTGAGFISADVALRPSDFPDSLLGRRCTTWDRYRVRNARVRYTPSVPTSINCNLITYHDQDVLDIPTQGTSALNIALAHRGAVQHPANMPQTIQCTPPREQLWTSPGTTQRLDAFGRIVVIQRQAPVDFAGNPLAAGTPLGDLTLEWTIDFECANLDPTPTLEPRPPLLISDIASTGEGDDVDVTLADGEWAVVRQAVVISGGEGEINDSNNNLVFSLTNTLSTPEVYSEPVVGPTSTVLATVGSSLTSYVVEFHTYAVRTPTRVPLRHPNRPRYVDGY